MTSNTISRIDKLFVFLLLPYYLELQWWKLLRVLSAVSHWVCQWTLIHIPFAVMSMSFEFINILNDPNNFHLLNQNFLWFYIYFQWFIPAIFLFHPSSEFDTNLKKPISSRYGGGLFRQLIREDGKTFNVCLLLNYNWKLFIPLDELSKLKIFFSTLISWWTFFCLLLRK